MILAFRGAVTQSNNFGANHFVFMNRQGTKIRVLTVTGSNSVNKSKINRFTDREFPGNTFYIIALLWACGDVVAINKSVSLNSIDVTKDNHYVQEAPICAEIAFLHVPKLSVSFQSAFNLYCSCSCSLIR